MISICMTTYNGSSFIEEQLNSILPQMDSDDEIIICDDLSTDDTVEIISGFLDQRIKLYINVHRLGHVRNFEKSIGKSAGELIVLSDQDDIWDKDKLKVIRDKFSTQPNLILFHHGITTIDSKGKVLSVTFNDIQSNYDSKGKGYKVMRSLIKHHYFGCCMSFRKKLISNILPFPKATYAHDHWITAVSLLKGEVICDNQSLIFYRQHDKNVSPKKGLGLLAAIKVRLQLIKLYSIALYRIRNV